MKHGKDKMFLVVDRSGHLRRFESKISAIVHINELLRTGLDCTVFAEKEETLPPGDEPETVTVSATNASYEARLEALECRTSQLEAVLPWTTPDERARRHACDDAKAERLNRQLRNLFRAIWPSIADPDEEC